jgi:hypothetical protein
MQRGKNEQLKRHTRGGLSYRVQKVKSQEITTIRTNIGRRAGSNQQTLLYSMRQRETFPRRELNNLWRRAATEAPVAVRMRTC